MLYRKATAPGPCRVIRGGQPWHGLMRGSTLALSNGGTRPCVAPDSGDTYYVKKPGLPVPTTPSSIAAQGGEWRNDAVLFAKQHRYAPGSPANIGGKQFFYFAPSGRVWGISIQVSVESPPFTISWDWVTQTGTTMTFRVRVTASSQGTALTLIDQNVSVTHPGWAYLGTPFAENSEPNFSVSYESSQGIFTWNGSNADHSPDGDQAAVHLRVAMVVLSGFRPFYWLGGWVTLQRNLVEFSEPVPGGNITAAMSVWRQPDSCFVLDYSITGGIVYSRVRCALVGTWRADGSYVEIDGEWESDEAAGTKSVRVFRDGNVVLDLVMNRFIPGVGTILLDPVTNDAPGDREGVFLATNNVVAATNYRICFIDGQNDIVEASHHAYFASPGGNEKQQIYYFLGSGTDPDLLAHPFASEANIHASWHPRLNQLAWDMDLPVCWV